MSEKFETLTSRVVPLPRSDVDTDQIVPARYLKVTEKNGLAQFLFADWRRDEDFILNQPDAAGAEVLLAGDNFGCGSSREHAPWALRAWGFRAIVSTSFADIFQNNALKNGIVPVVVTEQILRGLFAARERDPALTVTVDVAGQRLVLPDGSTVTFPIDPFAQHRLVEGVDELGYLLGFAKNIAEYEASHGR